MRKKNSFLPALPGLLALAALGCSRAGQVPSGAPAQAPPAAADVAAGCGDQGYLVTTLVGAVETDIDWGAAELVCEGMPRPNGEGVRLRFAGRADDRRLTIIIALPGLRRDQAASELASNVTLIEEGAGRFFSTADTDICWTDVTLLEPGPGVADRYRIGGKLYCVAPLAEVNGSSSVSLAELEFRGLLDWGAS